MKIESTVNNATNKTIYNTNPLMTKFNQEKTILTNYILVMQNLRI